jgi:hypothetical protein
MAPRKSQLSYNRHATLPVSTSAFKQKAKYVWYVSPDRNSRPRKTLGPGHAIRWPFAMAAVCHNP